MTCLLGNCLVMLESKMNLMCRSTRKKKLGLENLRISKVGQGKDTQDTGTAKIKGKNLTVNAMYHTRWLFLAIFYDFLYLCS
jgi:hypothetical protein